jgi:hypothetical protein
MNNNYRLSKKERDNLESYFVDAGFIMGSPDFEKEVARLRQNISAIRDILRQNVQMKVFIEKMLEKTESKKTASTVRPINRSVKTNATK